MSRLSSLLPGRRGAERLVFAFVGGTGAWPGMATDLYAAERAFRDTVRECAPIVADRTGYDPLPAFEAGVAAPTKRDELVLLGLVQLGQLALWRDAGVEPDAVLGVSLGEMMAVHAAGGLTLEDTVAVLTSILGVVHTDPEDCTLFAVEASAAEAAALTESAPVELELLGTTSPRIAILLSRAEDAHAARRHVAAEHAILKETPSRHAHHTRRRASMLPRLERELAGVRPRPAGRPCFLASCGRDVQSDGRFDARFWAWMVESPYFFGEAAAAALAGDPVIALQIGAEPSLAPALRETVRAIGARAEILATTHRDAPGTVTWPRARQRVLRRRAPRSERNHGGRAAAFDPDDPATVRDPWPGLAALRERGPVHRLRNGSFLVVDTALIDDALTRPNDFSNRMWRESVDFALLGADPPEHGRVRRLVGPVLGPTGVDPLADHAAAVAREVAEPLAGVSWFDAVRDLAEPVVHATVARLLEIDEEELGRRPSAAPTAKGDPALARSQRAFRGLADPPGVVERLALDEKARQSLVKLLWFAGTLTTVRHLGWAVLELDRRPELRAEVAGGGRAAEAFLDEILRLHPPELFLRRIAAADVRLGGTLIPSGASVSLAIGAANRDPQRFDEPDRLRLDRPATATHTFGHGPHRCPGARLSRHMARAAVDALLESMPGFRVVQPDAALRYVASPGHGLASLAVAPVR
ncbi:MAG TPA: cytochrome P450 [Solirubrobacteraceae bacterium]|nr:cytochrome P450 [Solirubrobacteraceae bacterium]